MRSQSELQLSQLVTTRDSAHIFVSAATRSVVGRRSVPLSLQTRGATTLHSRDTGHRLWLILMPDHAWLRTCAGRQRFQAAHVSAVCESLHDAAWSFDRLHSSHRTSHIVRSDF